MVNRSKDLRARNREHVIQKLLSQKNVSRQEIMRTTGLASSTISSLISELIEEGMIQKIGAVGTEGSGRRKDVLARVSQYAAVISISMTFANNNISLVDLGLNILYSRELVFNSKDERSVTEILIREIQEIQQEFATLNIVAISLALPHYPYKWHVIQRILKASVTLPLLMINNVEAMAVYDHYLFKENRDQKSLFYIFVGEGIGSAFIINGELYRGMNGFASDLGHIHMTDLNYPCRCGRTGCLETVASEDALKKSLRKMNGYQIVSSREMLEKLRHGLEEFDHTITGILENAAGYLAEAIHTVIALLDPSQIIISSRLNKLNPYYSTMIEESLYSLFGNRSPFSIKMDYIDFNRDSGVKGAALFAFLTLYCGKK